MSAALRRSLPVCELPGITRFWWRKEQKKENTDRRSFLCVLFQASLICFTYAHCLSLASLLVAWHRFSCIFSPLHRLFSTLSYGSSLFPRELSRAGNVLRSLRAETCSLCLSSPFFLFLQLPVSFFFNPQTVFSPSALLERRHDAPHSPPSEYLASP